MQVTERNSETGGATGDVPTDTRSAMASPAVIGAGLVLTLCNEIGQFLIKFAANGVESTERQDNGWQRPTFESAQNERQLTGFAEDLGQHLMRQWPIRCGKRFNGIVAGKRQAMTGRSQFDPLRRRHGDDEIDHRLSGRNTLQAFVASRLAQVESLARGDLVDAVTNAKALVRRRTDGNTLTGVGLADRFSGQAQVTNRKSRARLVGGRLDAQAISQMHRVARNKGEQASSEHSRQQPISRPVAP